MTNGTSQGLFIVVAIVIFGVFVGLSYTIFGDELGPSLVNLFEESFVQSTDAVNGVLDRQLLNLHTVNLDIAQNGFTLEKDYTNKELTLESERGLGGGIKIPTAGLLKINTAYYLEFDMEVLSGKVEHVGGHLGLTEDADVYINDELTVSGNDVGNDWTMGVHLPNTLTTNNKINVKVYFTANSLTDGQYEDAPLKIQPNRLWNNPDHGYGEPYKVKISNLSFAELRDNE